MDCADSRGAHNVVINQGSPNANPSIGINGATNAAVSATAEIGQNSGQTGLVTLSNVGGKPVASWTVGGLTLAVGEGGTGTINISNGAVLTNTTSAALIGVLSTGIGTVTVDGVGSLWNVQTSSSGSVASSPVIVGNSGNGTVTITNGAQVETTGDTANVVIGNNANSVGQVTVGSAGSPNLANPSTLTNNFGANSAGTLYVGYGGTGTLTINSDGAVSGFAGMTVGSQSGGNGTVTINGGTMTFSGPTPNVFIGDAGVGTLTIQSGGQMTSANTTIANQTGSGTSSVTVTGTGTTWNNTGGLTVGEGAAGTLTISNGATVNVGVGGGNGFVIADGVGSGGSSVTVNGGTLTESSGNGITIGGGDTAAMTVKGGGQVTTNSGVNLGLGFFGGPGNSSLTITGTGSQFTTTSGAVFIGSATNSGAGGSTGTLSVLSGGQFSAHGNIDLGLSPDGGSGITDSITVDGGGSKLSTTSNLRVGFFGTGNLVISGGATVTDVQGDIAFSSTNASGSLIEFGNTTPTNSVGTATVTGAGSLWQNTGNLVVGNNSTAFGAGFGVGTATGTLNILAGGAVTDVNGIIGMNTGATGTATVDGAGSTWTNSATLTVGNSGVGTLTVSNGGQVSATGITVAANAGSTGTINVGAAIGQAAVAPGTISAPNITFGSGTGGIVFNHTNTNYLFGASIQGAGSVDVESGTTIFTANSTYTGGTTINGGMLVVNGSIANSATTVNNGGAISGTGTVGALTVNSGGTLAPGPLGAPGTMTVAGNLAFQSGAIYLVQVTPSAASEAMVSGTATLAGTVNAQFAPGSYMGRSYTILSANGGRSGTFDNLVTNLGPGFTESLSYTSTDAILNLSAALGNGTTLNQNQQNVANALNNFFNNGGALPPGFLSLFNLAGANLGRALTLLDGEVATGAQTSSFQLMSEFLGLMLDPFVDGRSGMGPVGSPAMGFAPERDARAGGPSEVSLAYASVLKAPAYKAPPPFEQRWTVWGTAFGGYNHTDGDPVVGSNNLIARTGGFAVGMDYRWRPDTTIGFALAGGGTGWSVANGLGSGRSDAFQAGVYGTTRSGSAYLSAALAYTGQWAQTDRVAFVLDHLTARFDPQGVGGRVEAGYRYALYQLAGINQFGVTPYAAVQAQSVHIPGYREIDVAGGGFGLNFATQTASDTRAEVGARFDQTTTFYTMPWTLRARAAYAHDWVSNPSAAAAFQVLPGSNFTVTGAAPAKDSALLSAGSELKVTRSVTLGAKLESQLAAHSQTYAGTGTVRVAW